MKIYTIYSLLSKRQEFILIIFVCYKEAKILTSFTAQFFSYSPNPKQFIYFIIALVLFSMQLVHLFFGWKPNEPLRTHPTPILTHNDNLAKTLRSIFDRIKAKACEEPVILYEIYLFIFSVK
jgi:hypothetical protein